MHRNPARNAADNLPGNVGKPVAIAGFQSDVSHEEKHRAFPKTDKYVRIMKLSMNSSVENRKALVNRLSELTGMKPHYDGVPGCTYTIGAYKVLKDGSIETEDGISDVLKALGAEGFIDTSASTIRKIK